MVRIPKHGDFQPRFVLFMQDMSLSPGDSFEPHEYIRWIDRHSAAFKKSIGKHYLDILSPSEHGEFTEYLSNKINEEETK